MIHLISGITEKRKKYIRKLAEEESLTPEHISEQELQDREISDLVSVQTDLFGGKFLYVIHDLARELDLKNLLSDYAESENIFVFSEATITKKIKNAFEKHNAIIQDFGKEVVKKEHKFNSFLLADALGERNKKKLWILLQEALKNTSAEEIHGILFWQIKNLLMVLGSNSNPGMHDFVYKKNQRFAQKWNKEELIDLSHRLVSVFHNRNVYRTLAIDLEKITLSI
jgi:DNA polymerase III delta subunit